MTATLLLAPATTGALTVCILAVVGALILWSRRRQRAEREACWDRVAASLGGRRAGDRLVIDLDGSSVVVEAATSGLTDFDGTTVLRVAVAAPVPFRIEARHPPPAPDAPYEAAFALTAQVSDLLGLVPSSSRDAHLRHPRTVLVHEDGHLVATYPKTVYLPDQLMDLIVLVAGVARSLEARDREGSDPPNAKP